MITLKSLRLRRAGLFDLFWALPMKLYIHIFVVFFYRGPILSSYVVSVRSH